MKGEHSPEVDVCKKVVEGRRLRDRAKAGRPQKGEGCHMIPCAEELQIVKATTGNRMREGREKAKTATRDRV